MLENNLIEFGNDEIGTPHYIGHRKSVKERFVTAGAEHFSDYELLEVMLFLSLVKT